MTEVVLHTNHGDIALDLDDANAPVTVANFLQYVRDGHYDNTVFHRVIDGFMIQGGGFEPGMRQKPARAPIANEAANGLKNETYTIAMARTSDPNSATSEFFICDGDQSRLDGGMDQPGYAAFGHVQSGMDVVRKIARQPAQDQMLVKPIRILKISRLP